mgnify:CR=1 FL=1
MFPAKEQTTDAPKEKEKIMARYTGPTNKLFRNYGVKDLSNRKLTTSMRQNASGQHGAVRKKLSEYAIHLNEKQKIRLTYLVSEKQFAKYYSEAARRKGVTGTILLQILESRLDNVLFRAGLGVTRKQTRQIVNHGHALVNGKKVDIPSYLVKAGDVITIKARSNDFIKICNNRSGNSKRYLTNGISEPGYSGEWKLVYPKNIKQMKNGGIEDAAI